MGSAGKVISSVASLAGSYLNWKSSPVKQRADAKKALEKEEKEMKDKIDAVSDAVHGGDEAAVNGILARTVGIVAVSIAMIHSAGCFTTVEERIVRVPSDRYVRCVTNNFGKVKHWEVPPVVMEELLRCKIELEECKKNAILNERTSK